MIHLNLQLAYLQTLLFSDHGKVVLINMVIFPFYLHFRLFCLPPTLRVCGAVNEKIVQSDSDYRRIIHGELFS